MERIRRLCVSSVRPYRGEVPAARWGARGGWPREKRVLQAMLSGSLQVRHDDEVRMAEKNDPAGAANQGLPKRESKASTMDASFDRWLVGQLRKLYDDVLEESVPDDLVRVVRAFDSEGSEAESSDESTKAEPGSRSRERKASRED
ncbi:MAG: hypothetical protein ACREH6_10430 [Geminicoccaceae bacterium]